MLDLTFGEQVKIILKRRGMTIKELAEIIGERTGKKMSRQNLTQRLGRDNFQEQDMRMIAEILECPFYLNILDDGIPSEKNYNNNIRTEERQETEAPDEALPSVAVAEEPVHGAPERDITIGELVDIHEELEAIHEEVIREEAEPTAEEESYEEAEPEAESYEEAELAVEAESYEEAELAVEAESYEEAEPAAETESHEEAETEEAVTAQPPERKEKKHSWRDLLRRKKKTEEVMPETTKGEEAAAEAVQEEEDGEDEICQMPLEELFDEEPAYEEGAGEETPEAAYEEEEPEEAPEEFAQQMEEEEDLEKGDVNPYTGHEYQSNSVRMHPTRIGYVQVYDRGNHQWTDMTEWAFLGYQERKKALLGKDYDPPIYLD